jgi:hypothetical protein
VKGKIVCFIKRKVFNGKHKLGVVDGKCIRCGHVSESYRKKYLGRR